MQTDTKTLPATTSGEQLSQLFLQILEPVKVQRFIDLGFSSNQDAEQWTNEQRAYLKALRKKAQNIRSSRRASRFVPEAHIAKQRTARRLAIGLAEQKEQAIRDIEIEHGITIKRDSKEPLSKQAIKAIKRKLLKDGWQLDHTSKHHGKVSSYYLWKMEGEHMKTIRISDHHLPETDQRNHYRNIGAACNWNDEIVVEL